MSSRRLDSIAVERAQAKFACAAGNISRDKPMKFFINSLYTALNTGKNKDIQRCKIWIIDTILPEQDKTRAFLVFLLTLCRDMQGGNLPTAADREHPTTAIDVPTAQKKRLHILYVLCDVAATLSLSQIDQHFRPLPNVDLKPARDELKVQITVLCQLAACGSEGPSDSIVNSVLPACTKRGLLSQQEAKELQAKIETRTGQDGSIVMEQLQIEHDLEIEQNDILTQEIVVDRILPTHHGVIDDSAAPWDILPPMNGLYLKQTRGFPLRAGALQGGIFLQNGGKQSSERVKSAVKSIHKNSLIVSRRFTQASEIANIDGMGNVVMKDADISTLNYASIALQNIPKIRALQDRFRSQAVGYSGVPKLTVRSKKTHGIQSDIQRAISLARGGARGGYGAGRGFRGGFRGNNRGGGFNNSGDYRGNGRF